jgi:hypothetical protein
MTIGSRMRRRTCAASVAAAACLLLSVPLVRADPAPAGSPPATPPSSGTFAAGAPTRAAAQRQVALKIAGLVVFVANSCPHLKPDYARFKEALHQLGLEQGELDQQETKNGYLAYTATYGQDVPANCARAGLEFGPNGKTLPDLFTAQ